VDNEPNGWYVFKYTIHGTLNGNAVDLTASSPPIKMTTANNPFDWSTSATTTPISRRR